MYYYRIAELCLRSECKISSFEMFLSNECKADITIERTKEKPPAGKELVSGSIVHRDLEDGWFFHPFDYDKAGVYVSRDYTDLKILGMYGDEIYGVLEWYVRIAIECMLARRGYVSIHASAVEIRGEAFAFTGVSGIGKSTRADSWIKGLNAKLINGDRPLIDTAHGELYGVPWDGKEQCFRNVHYPLRLICEVMRSDSVSVKEMSFEQKRNLLLSQCFIPMWDNETAAVQMANIIMIIKNIPVIQGFSGPLPSDAAALYDAFVSLWYPVFS